MRSQCLQHEKFMQTLTICALPIELENLVLHINSRREKRKNLVNDKRNGKGVKHRNISRRI